MSRGECKYGGLTVLHTLTDAYGNYAPQWQNCREEGWLCDMCKRDYEMAGRAMQGLLSRDAHHVPGDIAELAVDCADALLAELAGETGGRGVMPIRPEAASLDGR